MSHERNKYKDNLDSFLQTIENSFVNYIHCDIDTKPQFDKQLLFFEFHYCNSISLKTSAGNFTIRTSMTSEALDTFWISPMEEDYKSNNKIKVDSFLKSLDIKYGHDNLPYKLVFQFESSKIFLYAAEIYDTITTENEYKINDEMILLFENEQSSIEFEKYLNCS